MATTSRSAALPVSMAAFQKLIQALTPNITLCVRGRHAVGKSEGVYQAATKISNDFYKSDEWQQVLKAEKNDLPAELKDHNYDLGLPVIERRLSQMTEGDIIGLPRLKDHEGGSYTSTQFKPCDWLVYACRFPVVLFLDERNRALEGVKQAVFQLTDSKAFYGYKLHPDTRIVIAENVGDSYQVNECDPAEVSRCATVTLEPSLDEWVSYAKEHCHHATIEFIKTEGGLKVLEHTDTFEPNMKYPDRRSWFKLDQMLQKQGLFERANDHVFYVVACSMLGVTVGKAFTDFCRAYQFAVSAEDILKNWVETKKRISNGAGNPTNEKWIECSEKLVNFIDQTYKASKSLDENQVENLAKFLKECPPEIRVKLFGTIQKIPSLLLPIFPHIRDDIMKAASDEYKPKANQNATQQQDPSQRGGKK